MKNYKKKRRRMRALLISIITFLSLTLVVVLWVKSKLDMFIKYEINEQNVADKKNDFTDDNIEGYWNIAIFGVDSRPN